MGTLAFIGIVIFTGINWSIYRKTCGTRIYFGFQGRVQAFVQELFICCLVAYFEVAIIMKLLGGIISFVTGLIGIVFKIIFYIAIIAVVICIIGFIVKTIKEKKEGNE